MDITSKDHQINCNKTYIINNHQSNVHPKLSVLQLFHKSLYPQHHIVGKSLG